MFHIILQVWSVCTLIAETSNACANTCHSNGEDNYLRLGSSLDQCASLQVVAATPGLGQPHRPNAAASLLDLPWRL